MNLYNWENATNARRKKVKKTGTVVLHSDEAVDTSFDRLQKEFPVERTKLHDNGEETVERTVKKAPLMTPETVKALGTKMGFEKLLPCQAQCYRGIFKGRDVILHSRTGSGKTLAYALPIIERYLLLERDDAGPTTGPFLLIFVFSNDLAVQTKGVLSKLYPKLSTAVAGMDDLTSAPVNILVGTVRALDEAIRGKKAAAAATAAEEREKAAEERLVQAHSRKRTREAAAESAEADATTSPGADPNADDSGDDSEDEADPAASTVANGVVSAASVRAIVVDEVDTTLGPRFSNVGRRMKNLLKAVRRANGALTDGLLTDYRAHHYVLCGATIPNWVLKAGFLGVKKYYYQLVAAGTDKLPDSLECFQAPCPLQERVPLAARLLAERHGELGRTVVFGTFKQVTRLEEALRTAASTVPTATGSEPKKKKKTAAATTQAALTVRVLTPAKDDLERIAAMEDFNSKVANVLLCTDLAARGLDFVEVNTVLMLSLPHTNMAAETFVHRAGRTARVNRAGRCIVLHDRSEAEVLDAVVKSVHVAFKTYTVPVVGGKDQPGSSSLRADSDPAAKTTFRLTVRNSLRFTRPNVKVPRAKEVLEKQLGAEWMGQVSAVTEADASGEVVTFAVPSSVAHEVKQKLWKYDLAEVSSSS